MPLLTRLCTERPFLLCRDCSFRPAKFILAVCGHCIKVMVIREYCKFVSSRSIWRSIHNYIRLPCLWLPNLVLLPWWDLLRSCLNLKQWDLRLNIDINWLAFQGFTCPWDVLRSLFLSLDSSWRRRDLDISWFLHEIYLLSNLVWDGFDVADLLIMVFFLSLLYLTHFVLTELPCFFDTVSDLIKLWGFRREFILLLRILWNFNDGLNELWVVSAVTKSSGVWMHCFPLIKRVLRNLSMRDAHSLRAVDVSRRFKRCLISLSWDLWDRLAPSL